MDTLSFKNWLEGVSNAKFDQRIKNQKLNLAQLLGFKKPMLQINRGSLANIYQHPEDPSKIVKITADARDAKNLWTAQRLNSPNIVKLYGQPRQVSPGAWAIIADKINGQPMKYDTNSFVILIQGEGAGSTADAAQEILYPSGIREKILNRFGMNTDAEHERLADLFSTIARIEQMRIPMSDFGQNIIDDGQKYVIIDLGA